jgi:hypothetical protein
MPIRLFYAKVSVTSPLARGLLCAPVVSWHVFLPNAVQAHEHLASLWLDLAEGRLRLDRLDRNG